MKVFAFENRMSSTPFGYQIEAELESVLTDSENDPHYSAVFVSNLAKCYLEFSEELGDCACTSLKELFSKMGYSEADCDRFEQSRAKESEYYIGKQF